MSIKQCNTENWPRLKSYSGDWYAVPPAMYQYEREQYSMAVSNQDEKAMLRFEEGKTGWINLEAA